MSGGGRHEHYVRRAAEGSTGSPEALDTHGGTLAWLPVQELPTTAL
ncbi:MULTISPECIES: hypothetical protein [Streptomyces]|nr:hypothetical protein [Streptomyces griseus]